MEVKEFFRKLRQHCNQQSNGNGENCRQCCFREFCFTPPINLSDEIVAQATKQQFKQEVIKHESKTNQRY